MALSINYCFYQKKNIHESVGVENNYNKLNKNNLNKSNHFSVCLNLPFGKIFMQNWKSVKMLLKNKQ